MDLNNDNNISMYEAHLYTLRVAESADLSRSTSEMYLEQWEPWFMRWFSFVPPGENIYNEIARDLAQRNALLVDNKLLSRELKIRRKALQRELDKSEKNKKAAEEEIKKNQQKIQKNLAVLWPDIMHPYTLGFVKFLNDYVNDAQKNIIQHPDYQDLVNRQDNFETVKAGILSLKRKITQLDKIMRLRKLSRLLDVFNTMASSREKAEYQQLLQCEKLPF